MGQLAYSLMHNSFLEPEASRSKAPGSSRASSPPGSPDDGCAHCLMPLTSVPGYQGGIQQRCVVCNAKVTKCCARCSTSPFSLVPLCPEVTIIKRGELKGKRIKHTCLARHRANPAALPSSGRSRKVKRKRSAATDGSESSEEPEDEEGGEEEDEDWD